MSVILSLFIVFLSFTPIYCVPVEKRSIPSKAGYKVTFADDFLGTSLSTANWKIDTGTSYPAGPSQWGTGEVQSYTKNTKNLLVSNGVLAITPTFTSNKWTSARIETVRSDFVAKAGGKLLIEASIWLGHNPAEKQLGIWPAFWAMGSAFRKAQNKGWPNTGEWDIMESINGYTTAYQTIHCGTNPDGACNEPNGRGVASTVSRGTYHTYTFVVDRTASFWRSETVSWYIDGVLKTKIRGNTVNNITAWANLVHQPFFLLLDVAVGGSFPNALAGEQTPTTATIGGSGSGLKADYIAVYNSV